MRLLLLTAALIAGCAAAAAVMPLPQLRVDATDGGSILRVRNLSTQPLTAWLIELVDYPGSSFALYQEESGKEPISPGAERSLSIANMTVGAAPEYVRMQAALYADGSTAGSPEKVAQLRGLRRATLDTTRELIARLGRGATAAELRTWAETLPAPTKRDRGTPGSITRSTIRDLIHSAASQVDSGSPQALLRSLQRSERALASAKPQ